MNYRSRTDEQLYDVTSKNTEEMSERLVREYAKLVARIHHRMGQDGEPALAQAA